MSNASSKETSSDPRVRLDAHTTEILGWLKTHKYKAASPVDIEFREPNERYPYERATVLLRSGSRIRICRGPDGDLEGDVMWLLGKS